MYPPTDILEEVGRVTIAGSRLDLEMGMLWAIIDPEADPEKARKARKAPGADQVRSVRKLANRWLAGDLLTAVLEMADRADQVRAQRNEIVHQDWILRGRDAMRSVSDLPPDFFTPVLTTRSIPTTGDEKPRSRRTGSASRGTVSNWWRCRASTSCAASNKRSPM